MMKMSLKDSIINPARRFIYHEKKNYTDLSHNHNLAVKSLIFCINQNQSEFCFFLLLLNIFVQDHNLHIYISV